MLAKLLGFLIIFVIAVTVIFWFLRSTPLFFSDTPFFTSPFGSTVDPDTGLSLPTYPIPTYTGIDLPYGDDGEPLSISADGRFNADIESELLNAEEEYDRLKGLAEEVRTFGDPSPYRGKIFITEISSGFQNTAPQFEYVSIEAGIGETAPVAINGWSLQSAVSGTRAYIPSGVRTFRMGAVASLVPITVEPGASVVITSGESPVGVSFRENSCTGYLEQFQTFVPSLSSYSCPRPSDELPATVENLQTYGEACVSFVSSLESCRVYTDVFPSDITPACRAYIQGALTYNGCVDRNQWRPSFVDPTWRVFLNKNHTLWQMRHDVIKLLDAEGRTVDTWSY